MREQQGKWPVIFLSFVGIKGRTYEDTMVQMKTVLTKLYLDFPELNYLLLDADGWRELSTYADYTVSVRAPEPLLRTRLIDRRIKTGVEEARQQISWISATCGTSVRAWSIRNRSICSLN